ncbi:MAG: PepSY domain-containing protein [Cyanobacteria bacterium J06639_14]
MKQSQANSPSAEIQTQGDDLSSKELPPVPTFEVTLQEAIKIAESEIEGKAYSIEQEIENVTPIIEVDLAKYEVVIHGQTREVLEVEDEEAEGDPEDIAEIDEALSILPHTTISLIEALEIAEAFANKQPNSAELENEDGNIVYEVVFGLQKIYIDAGNGAILHSGDVEPEGSQQTVVFKSSVQLPKQD